MKKRIKSTWFAKVLIYSFIDIMLFSDELNFNILSKFRSKGRTQILLIVSQEPNNLLKIQFRLIWTTNLTVRKWYETQVHLFSRTLILLTAVIYSKT